MVDSPKHVGVNGGNSYETRLNQRQHVLSSYFTVARQKRGQGEREEFHHLGHAVANGHQVDAEGELGCHVGKRIAGSLRRQRR